jgi:hypothetical protein
MKNKAMNEWSNEQINQWGKAIRKQRSCARTVLEAVKENNERLEQWEMKRWNNAIINM